MRGRRVAFIATAEAGDEEMRQRITRHREERPAAWATIEAPLALEEALLECGHNFDTILVDCLTVWTANVMQNQSQEQVVALADRLASTLRSMSASVILVSNEVGSGIVPDNELGRAYRDLLGAVNQRVAAAADEVVLLVAGCPLLVKQPIVRQPAEALA